VSIQQIDIFAPAKLNLHLRVLAPRADGFHGIESIFQSISLSDKLRVSLTDVQGSCDFACRRMDLPPDNTVTRAVRYFREATGFTAGVRVDLEKRIPSGAGLGGGSSDAASVLIALDSLAGTGLSQVSLAEIGSRVGSDVPFFIYGGAAVVTGRGELISPIRSRTDLFGVLIWPGVHSSTPEGYRLVDEWSSAGRADLSSVPPLSELPSRYAGNPASWGFLNSFTAPLEERYPVIREARELLLSAGAAVADMSGSGSSVYGLFNDAREARDAWTTASCRFEKSFQFLLLASGRMQ